MSIDLADSRTVCECGSSRLTPSAPLEPGALVICAACASPHRVTVALSPVRWSDVEQELEARPHELYAMRWHRQGVLPQNRRSLPELQLGRKRFSAADRSGAILGAVLAALLLLVILKAVIS